MPNGDIAVICTATPQLLSAGYLASSSQCQANMQGATHMRELVNSTMMHTMTTTHHTCTHPTCSQATLNSDQQPMPLTSSTAQASTQAVAGQVNTTLTHIPSCSSNQQLTTHVPLPQKHLQQAIDNVRTLKRSMRHNKGACGDTMQLRILHSRSCDSMQPTCAPAQPYKRFLGGRNVAAIMKNGGAQMPRSGADSLN
jgi:hypothetical protein